MSPAVPRVRGLAVHRRPPLGGAHPAGPPVVAVHGAMDRSASFARLTRLLPTVEVVRYDRRGYGRSADQPPAADLDEAVDDLLAVAGAAPVVVVGHSMGGLIALAAALHHPDRFAALVALEAPLPWRHPPDRRPDAPWAEPDVDPAAAAEEFLRRTVGDATWESLPARAQADRRAEGPALLADLRALRRCPPLDPGALDCPVVVGHGSATSERHRTDAVALARAAPTAELVEVAGADHLLHATHPAAVADLVDLALRRAADDRDADRRSAPR